MMVIMVSSISFSTELSVRTCNTTIKNQYNASDVLVFPEPTVYENSTVSMVHYLYDGKLLVVNGKKVGVKCTFWCPTGRIGYLEIDKKEISLLEE